MPFAPAAGAGNPYPVPLAPCESDFAFCPRCGNSRTASAPSAPTTTPTAPPASPPGTADAVLRAGSARHAPRGDADRRQVTVLFADRRLGLLDHLAVPLIVLGQIYQCHGEHAQALACYEEALGHAETAGEPQLLFPCYDGLATLYLDVGDQNSGPRFIWQNRNRFASKPGWTPTDL